jgi:hypothetical protein
MALNYDEVKPLSHQTQQIFKEILIDGGYPDTNFQKIKNNLGRWEVIHIHALALVKE